MAQLQTTNYYGKDSEGTLESYFGAQRRKQSLTQSDVIEHILRQGSRTFNVDQLDEEITAEGKFYKSIRPGNTNRTKAFLALYKKLRNDESLDVEYNINGDTHNASSKITIKMADSVESINNSQNSDNVWENDVYKYESVTREESNQYIQELKDLGLTQELLALSKTKAHAYRILFLVTGLLGKSYREMKDAENFFMGYDPNSRTQHGNKLINKGYVGYINFRWCQSNIKYDLGKAPRVPINLTESGRAYLVQQIRLLPDSVFKDNVLDKLSIEETSGYIQDVAQTEETVNKEVQLSKVYETENLVTKAESLVYINFLKSKGITQEYMNHIENKTYAYRILFLLTGVLGKCYRMLKDAERELIENKPSSRASIGRVMRKDGYVEYMDFEGDNNYIKYKDGVAPRVPITVTESGRIYLMELVTALPDSEIRTNLLALLVGTINQENSNIEIRQSVEKVADKEQSQAQETKEDSKSMTLTQYIESSTRYAERQLNLPALVEYYDTREVKEDYTNEDRVDVCITIKGDIQVYIHNKRKEKEKVNTLKDYQTQKLIFSLEKLVERINYCEEVRANED